VLHVAANFWAIHRGYGLPLHEIEEARIDGVEKVRLRKQDTLLANRSITQALFTGQLSYIVSVGLTRVSTAFFVRHLTRHLPQVRMSYILVAVSGVWTAVSTLVVALRPNIARPWATLDGTEALVGLIQLLWPLDLLQPNSPQHSRWIAVEATGLAIEVALWALSISLIWSLQMKIQKRVLILSAFGCRLLYIAHLPSPSRKLTQLLRLIPIVAIRLFYLSPSRNHNPTVTSILPHIWTEGALEYAIISTSVTSLKPFLRPFHTGAIVNTVGGGGSGLYSGSRPREQGIYMLNSIGTDKKCGGQTTTTTARSEDGNTGPQPRSKLYTGNIEGVTMVSSGGDPHRDDIDSVESNSSERMIIRTTKEWAVRYENA